MDQAKSLGLEVADNSSLNPKLEEVLYSSQSISGPYPPNPYKSIDIIKVVNNQIGSEKIKFLKSEFQKFCHPIKFDNTLNDEGYLSNENWKTLGMGEYYFSGRDMQETGASKSHLHTIGIKDCMGIVGFDAKTKKGFLYHCSKMELRKNDFGDVLIEEGFIKKFKEFFKSICPQVYVIGSCYNSDVSLLLAQLQKHDIQIHGFDFPDIFFEQEPELVLEEGKIKQNCTCIYAEKNAYEYDCLKQGLLPETRIVLDLNLSSVIISRK